MWKFKPFMGKEQVGLEGRTVDIGNLKLNIRNVIAEGGFSSVYLARDVNQPSQQYALKHIICNDQELVNLVVKEISVMKSLKGHPNVVSLQAQTILDMGRTKEALIVMEYCEKSLVSVLESRGAVFFDEKSVLKIFRDVCNAVFAMHCQSPPIAHRDLKAENLLLGQDGAWKLCDFGSTSTNHKRFERPEEMGLEEDNIRKHTTPAYRAPEMWDLFRKELINEKVDIWALGCLLFRICYFKSVFDGESKLQILNGNYRIPEMPKYSSSVTDLIKEMLQSSPDDRPDITQVWFRVNELLPAEIKNSLPDRPVDMRGPDIDVDGMSNSARRSSPSPVPRRSPPPPPSSKEPAQTLGGGGAPLGAFWSTQHAKTSPGTDKSSPIFDEEPNRGHLEISPPKDLNMRSRSARISQDSSIRKSVDRPSKDFEIKFYSDDANRGSGKTRVSQTDKVTSQNETFNTFVADFDTAKLDSRSSNSETTKEQSLKAEVDKLKEQLQQSNLEKAEITAKYEKLSAICRSQRQELQELKQALAARTPSPNRDPSKYQTSPASNQSVTPPQREKKEGTIWELQEGMFAESSPTLDSQPWKPFTNEPKPQTLLSKTNSKSVRTTNGHQNKPASSPGASSTATDSWGFGTDNFTAVPTSSNISRTSPSGQGNNSQRFGDYPRSSTSENKQVSQPAGWAGF
ncbi:probable serine/threonine-protein kinase DDB_G0276461 [Papaver somniferum]|uniref:probable serine/threonine-protein kinase DDB_G0276461 n=1 Tax=Papaver somniferum TaxID=3469 RepID=UPI000E704DEB|nr:probable serine/threonine-protein kinase DDB_G0276461 [Papaver somniferum]XP_026414530.1 probable serine/threonine-protein kinase DDB_G0276461 [Papaver somniferum]